MGKGTRYPHVETLIRKHYRGGVALELGAGGAVYRDMFDAYVGVDLQTTQYADDGDIAVHCDAQLLPFRPESFDFCFVVAALCLMPRADDVCREVHRCLRPGGTFLVFDYTRPTLRKIHQRHVAQSMDIPIHTWTGPELHGKLDEAGFGATRHPTGGIKDRILGRLPGISDRREGWLVYAGRKR